MPPYDRATLRRVEKAKRGLQAITGRTVTGADYKFGRWYFTLDNGKGYSLKIKTELEG